eukprot:5363467-Prymnesium_polylepis.1
MCAPDRRWRGREEGGGEEAGVSLMDWAAGQNGWQAWVCEVVGRWVWQRGFILRWVLACRPHGGVVHGRYRPPQCNWSWWPHLAHPMRRLQVYRPPLLDMADAISGKRAGMQYARNSCCLYVRRWGRRLFLLVAVIPGARASTASIFDASVSTGTITTYFKFCGAAAVGNLVVFAPNNANVVG